MSEDLTLTDAIDTIEGTVILLKARWKTVADECTSLELTGRMQTFRSGKLTAYLEAITMLAEDLRRLRMNK